MSFTKMVSSVNRELTCILCLSFCFMLLFAADFTIVNMQKVIVSSIADEQAGFAIDGYTVAGLSYTVFAVFVWFGPYVTYALGPRLTMVLSAFGYLCFVGSYAIEYEWAIYTGAVIGGLAASTMWPAQGHYMIQNSSPNKTARNVGIFWFIFSCSNMLGNLFVYYTFYGKKYIKQSTRRTALYLLVCINITATLSLLTLPKSAKTHKAKEFGPFKTIKKSWSILTSKRMLWVVPAFVYSGSQQSLWNGILSPSIGFTLAFGDSVKELVALSGIFMSIGALTGAFFTIVFSGWIRKHRFARRLIVITGCFVHLAAYLIAFINLPDTAVFGNTDHKSIIHPSAVLAMLGSFLMCVGDSCLTTQIYSFIGDHYRDSSAEATALYKFINCIMVSISFYWCNHIGLHKQLVIMAVLAVIGVAGFFVADRENIVQTTETEISSKPETEGCDNPCPVTVS